MRRMPAAAGSENHRLGFLVSEHHDVELRPEALHDRREQQRIVARRAIRRVDRQPGRQDLFQQRNVARRRVGKALVDHHRLEVGVEDDTERRVFERADEHGLVNELVLRAAQLPHLLDVCGPARGRRRRDEEDLEVWLRGRLPHRGRHHALRRRRVVLRLPLAGIAAIALRHQRRRDALHQPRRAQRVPAGHAVLDGVQDASARIGLEVLHRRDRVERVVTRSLQARLAAAG